MTKLASEIIAEVASHSAAEQVSELIKKFCECGTGAAIAAVIGGTTMPLLIPAVVLIGAKLLLSRHERKEDHAFDHHCEEVLHLLKQLSQQSTTAADQLANIAEHKTWVAAKLHWSDQKQLAQRVADAITLRFNELDLDDRIDGIFVYFNDIGFKLDRLQKGVDDANATLAALADGQATILQFIESLKKPGADPTQVAYPSQVLAAAKLLQERGSLEQKALADTIAKRYAEADAILSKLLADPLAESFRLLTQKGDNWYAAGQFDKAIEPYETALALRSADIIARNNAAIAHNSARLGNIAAHQRRAIEIYQGTLLIAQPRSADWAMTQNNLGAAWRNLPTGDKAANLAKAIAAYESALQVYTKADFPADWAMTQNNLGNAWGDLPTGDRAANLAKAIAAYESALQVYTKADFPADWAMTQNNLGNAWLYLPTGDKAANLAKAIAAYESALQVRTKADFPADWAMTHYNLAIALADLAEQPAQDRCGLLRRAIASDKAALLVRTPEAFPRDHADTTKNMAIDRRAYESAGCDKAMKFDDIPPAE